MNIKYNFLLLLFLTSKTQTTSWLESGALPQTNQTLLQQNPKSNLVVTTYPMLNIDHAKGSLQQIIQNRKIKATLPLGIVPLLKKSNFSTLQGKATDYSNYPAGAALFPNYPALATKFDTLLTLFKQHPEYISFLRKIHLNVLNQLYEHLMNIYTNFNLQENGIYHTQTAGGKTTEQIYIPAFIQNETVHNQNKKTLIINHLINIIESQLNSAIRAIMPEIPHTTATYSGKILIQNDYSVDLTNFIIKQTTANMIKYKQVFLQALAIYISFFQEYTSYLMMPHPAKGQHFTAFVDIAETINNFIYGKNGPEQQTSPDHKIQQLLQKMNPPLFNFNYDDIRALKLIPHLAKSLTPSLQPIGWPAQIMQSADAGYMVNGCPIGYFKDSTGKVSRQANASSLFVVIKSGANFFEEELLQEPSWLSNWNGIAAVLKACFGDFSAILNLNILDPCTQAVIQNGVLVLQGKDVNSTAPLVSACQNYLSQENKNQKQQIPNPTINTNPGQNNQPPAPPAPPAPPGTNQNLNITLPPNNNQPPPPLNQNT